MLKISKYAHFAFAGLLLSCAEVKQGNYDHIDRYSELNRSDYQDYLNPKKIPATKTGEVETKVETKVPPLPKISDVLINPSKPKIGNNKTVSISVTEDVPLKDVFLELAKLADVDIEVDPSITGGVIFKATNKPFAEVVERICDLAGLTYAENKGVIRIMADKPYTESYQASFLNIIRKNTGNIATSNKLLGAGGGSSSGGSSSGGSSSGSSSSGSSGISGSESSITSNSGGGGDLWVSIQNELNSIIGASAEKGTDSRKAADSAPDEKYVSLNREAGIISVKTTAKNHAKVKQYLDKVKDYYSSQVLIEAKVVEVSLSDQFSSGIDWSLITKKVNGIKGININTNFPSASNSFATLNFASGDITAAVDLAQIFGTTKTLSSPRILVMNNQQAILSFAKNQTYFSLSCDVTDAVYTGSPPVIQTPAKLKLTSTPNTVPIGVILNLQASIDSKNGEISMNVRPTLSRLTGTEFEDPGVTACVKNFDPTSTVTSKIPQVDVREMDSILRMKSGEIMAIGGMIDQKDSNTDSGVPWASEIPILGNAFKTVEKNTTAVQTVIFLKATIVPGYGVDEKDQEMYNKFNSDPRPFKF